MVKQTMGICICATTGVSTTTAHLALHSDGHVHLVQELHANQRLCMSTGTSTTIDEVHQQGHRHCNCGTSTVSAQSEAKHLSSQQRAYHHRVQELQLRNSTGCTVWTITLVLHHNGQDTKSTTCTTGTPTTTSKKSTKRSKTQPAPPRRRRHRNPATATPRPTAKNSSLGSFMMNSAGASTPEPARPPTTRARPCRATSLALGEVDGKRVGALADTATVTPDRFPRRM